MKKLNKVVIILFLFITSIISLCSFTRATVEVGVINDKSSINTDLMKLDLTPSDYITYAPTRENSYLDEVYLIAIGENRINQTSTDLYLYFYNPIIEIHQDYYLNLKINNQDVSLVYLETNRDWSYYEGLFDKPDVFLKLCDYNEDKNITKVKFNYSNAYSSRDYIVDEICRLTDESYFTNPFSASFKENTVDGRIETEFSYNSFIYITNDVLQPIQVKQYTTGSLIGDWLVDVWKSIWSDKKEAILYFYNFSSSKKIDKILELDCIYKEKIIKEARANGGVRKDVVSEHAYTKESPKTLLNGVLSQNIYGQNVELNRFMTPSSNRINEIGDSISWNDELKSLFNNYEHSVLVDIGAWEEKTSSPVWSYNYLSIEDFKITRLKFSTDGKIYNSYVGDVDGPDNPEEPIIPSDPNIPNLNVIIPVILGILGGLILLLFSGLLIPIIKGVFILLKNIFLLIFNIILFPFKMILSLFRKDKK